MSLSPSLPASAADPAQNPTSQQQQQQPHSNNASSTTTTAATTTTTTTTSSTATTAATTTTGNPASLSESSRQLLCDFQAALTESMDAAVPVAACCALHGVVLRTSAATVLDLLKELTFASDLLKQHVADITVVTGSDVYLRMVSKVVQKTDMLGVDFKDCLEQIRRYGKHFQNASKQSRLRVAKHGNRFIQEDGKVLVHGYSRCVMSLLTEASKQKHFDVYVLEARPGQDGFRCAKELSDAGLHVTLLPDSAVGFIMEKIDIVLVGAHGVVESGGIINKLGTSTVAVVASAMNKPLYVAVESHKFVRIFPISQVDMQTMTTADQTLDDKQVEELIPTSKKLPESVDIEMPTWDYTSPEHITLLVTDIGVFTPSAVSDELIKLYQ